ncbi:MAG: hypothetical protein ACK5KN_04270 [Dysgonomonas sp.]|uniref:hypothetical protein n=1 Tax=Dysgonomonas sp. TaxID=1891233 RepID=UPI003A8BD4FB
MKAIYQPVINRLSSLLQDNTLRWADMDKGQLKKVGEKDRPPLNYPCALISINIGSTKDITDTVQDCRATVTMTLAFDPAQYMRSSAGAPEDVRDKALEPYDIIARVYGLLQGFGTDAFDSLRRRSQGEVAHNSLFVYRIVFNCEFEDNTADE